MIKCTPEGSAGSWGCLHAMAVLNGGPWPPHAPVVSCWQQQQLLHRGPGPFPPSACSSMNLKCCYSVVAQVFDLVEAAATDRLALLTTT